MKSNYRRRLIVEALESRLTPANALISMKERR
jgi:hypothetical protein